MKNTITKWFERQKFANKTLLHNSNDTQKRHNDIFRIRTQEVIFMGALFVTSFILFHYSYWAIPNGEWKTPILMMIKIIINLSLFGIAHFGMKSNKHKHPQYLILMLVLYAIGDLLSCISSYAGGIPYFLAQIVWCILLYKETFVNRFQYLVFFILIILAIPLIIFCDQGHRISIGIFIYIIPLFAACAMSLTSPFFLMAGCLFVASDCAAFIRASFPKHDAWYVYLITGSLYCFAVLLICCSTYVTKPKSSVTLPEMLYIVKILKKHNVRFWLAGPGSANLYIGYFFSRLKYTKLICDSRDLGAYKAAMIDLGYICKKDELILPRKLYCEKFGLLITYIVVFDEEKTYIKTDDGKVFTIDDEFLGEKQFGKTIIPCVTIGL